MEEYGHCPWGPVLDHNQKTTLGAALIFTGLVGSATNGWLVSCSCVGRPGAKAHALLTNTCAAALCRSLIGGFPFSATSALAGRWLFGLVSCQMLGFLHQFFGLAELLSMALQAAERLYAIRQRHIGKKLMVISLATVWSSALIWSILPMLGIGRLGCNLTGVSCSIDWRPLRGTQYWFNTAYLAVAVALPITFIVGVLLFVCMCSCEVATQHQREEKSTTIALINMVVGMMVLWLPGGILTLMIVLRLEPYITSLIVILAPISMEVASMVPTVAFLCHDARLRRTVLGGEGPDGGPKPNNRRLQTPPPPCCCCCWPHL